MSRRERQRPTGGTDGLLAPGRRTMTLGLTASVTVVALLWLGVTTVMPAIAEELDGLDLYGWAFTGFMLANMVAAATVGPWADRAGPLRPFVVALVAFMLGCVVAAVAPSWLVLLAGRTVQGFGVGGVLTIVYLTVGLKYPDALRAKMLAVVASCWTVPALVGPVVLGTLAEQFGWRTVFAIFVPLTIVGALPAVPALRGSGGGGAVDRQQLLATMVLAVGASLLLVGLQNSANIVVMLALAVPGLLVTLAALHRLMPAGFLVARRGLASSVLARGLVSAGYYGSEAFIPLVLTTVFAFSTLGAGLGLAVGAISWVAGAWGQARLDVRQGDRGRRNRTAIGFLLLALGLATIGASVVAPAILGAWAAVLGWGIGGLGMGLVYPSVTTLALAQTDDEEKGTTSGNLQLSETLSVAVITGLASSIMGAAKSDSWNATNALALVLGLTTFAAACGVAVALRMRTPHRRSGTHTDTRNRV